MASTSAPKPPAKKLKVADSESSVELLFSGDLIELESPGYIPFRADVEIPALAKVPIKRLALTLDARGARLKDGTLVKNSVPKAIAWLLEQFADSVE